MQGKYGGFEVAVRKEQTLMEKEKKIRIPLWLYPSVEDKIMKNFEADNCKSPSEFIEKAIIFYCGYLASEEYKQYLPNVIISTMQGSLDSFEDRMATLLFKIAVELCMMLHVTAATNQIDESTLTKLRGLCVDEVKKLRGSVRLENAVNFQNGN